MNINVLLFVLSNDKTVDYINKNELKILFDDIKLKYKDANLFIIDDILCGNIGNNLVFVSEKDLEKLKKKGFQFKKKYFVKHFSDNNAISEIEFCLKQSYYSLLKWVIETLNVKNSYKNGSLDRDLLNLHLSNSKVYIYILLEKYFDTFYSNSSDEDLKKIEDFTNQIRNAEKEIKSNFEYLEDLNNTKYQNTINYLYSLIKDQVSGISSIEKYFNHLINIGFHNNIFLASDSINSGESFITYKSDKNFYMISRNHLNNLFNYQAVFNKKKEIFEYYKHGRRIEVLKNDIDQLSDFLMVSIKNYCSQYNIKIKFEYCKISNLGYVLKIKEINDEKFNLIIKRNFTVDILIQYYFFAQLKPNMNNDSFKLNLKEFQYFGYLPAILNNINNINDAFLQEINSIGWILNNLNLSLKKNKQKQYDLYEKQILYSMEYISQNKNNKYMKIPLSEDDYLIIIYGYDFFCMTKKDLEFLQNSGYSFDPNKNYFFNTKTFKTVSTIYSLEKYINSELNNNLNKNMKIKFKLNDSNLEIQQYKIGNKKKSNINKKYSLTNLLYMFLKKNLTVDNKILIIEEIFVKDQLFFNSKEISSLESQSEKEFKKLLDNSLSVIGFLE